MNSQANKRGIGKRSVLLAFLVLALAVVAAAGAFYWQKNRHIDSKLGQPQKLEQVESVKTVKDSYDVIVVGTDPEGITAAISAARNGLSTLLVDGRDRPILG
jgi:alkyl hydroperoxide reductase subunit AhpF